MMKNSFKSYYSKKCGDSYWIKKCGDPYVNYVDMESNKINSTSKNVVAINLKLLHFFFLNNCSK